MLNIIYEKTKCKPKSENFSKKVCFELISGNIPAGTSQFSLHGIANGNYIVRAKIGSSNYTKKISIR